MFKQPVENKQAKTETYKGLDDRPITRADIEDPARPGFLRSDLVPIDPSIWGAGAHFGLFTPTGRPMAYVEVKPDPREPRVDEAPADLRRRAEEAEAALDAVRGRIQAAIDERLEAQADWRHAAARGDAEAYNRAVAREHESMGRQTDLGPEETQCNKRVADAQAAVRRWLWDERLRRYAEAKEKV